MHRKLKIHTFILLAFVAIGCKTPKEDLDYESKSLKVDKIGSNTFVHVSYLETESFGRVSCNGMIVIDDGEALIVDTPIEDRVSKELIGWIKNTLNCKPIGVIATHFHDDCLGGLNEFHGNGIPSYASLKTIDLAKSDSITSPQIGFENHFEIKVGNSKVINEFIGEGHTQDNIVSYFPNDKVLFGGCLIKRVNAKKGYLGDANINEWSNTVRAVKSKYKDAEIIIPGHGKPGGQELLSYTIELFKVE